MAHDVPPAPLRPRLYLIRHGETEWALSGRHTGRTDIALTANGEDQARTLVPMLGTIRFAHVFTSPLQRARQTCALAGLGASAEVEPDLAEWDYGDYEGRRSTDIRADRPGWTVYRDGCPGGEDASQVSDRVDRLIARLQALDGNIALFSHGQLSCSFATAGSDCRSATGSTSCWEQRRWACSPAIPAIPTSGSSSDGTHARGAEEIAPRL